MEIDPDNPVPMYSRLREIIRADIDGGRYGPLSKLPSESEFSALYFVSRTTVRQALAELQNERRIFKVHGKGAFVCQKRATQNITTLEGFGEAMSRAGHTTRNEVLSMSVLAASETVSGNLGLPMGQEVFELRRLRYMDDLPISLDVSYFPLEIGRRLQKIDLTKRDVFLILEDDLSLQLGTARLGIEATVADPELSRLLGVGAHSPVLRIERVTHSADGIPIDFEYLFYRSDRFRYELSISREHGAGE